MVELLIEGNPEEIKQFLRETILGGEHRKPGRATKAIPKGMTKEEDLKAKEEKIARCKEELKKPHIGLNSFATAVCGYNPSIPQKARIIEILKEDLDVDVDQLVMNMKKYRKERHVTYLTEEFVLERLSADMPITISAFLSKAKGKAGTNYEVKKLRDQLIALKEAGKVEEIQIGKKILYLLKKARSVAE